METTVFTVVARNYLALALTLGDSVRQHLPGSRFVVFVADGLDGVDPSALAHEVVAVESCVDAALFSLRFVYEVTEFCTAVKPALFGFLLRGGGLVIYLDPDTRVYGPLQDALEDRPGAALWLTPHLLHPRVADDRAYPEQRHLWEGVFNLGFCAMRASPEANAVVEWWDARLRRYAFCDYTDGLHTDQKWMDYAPVFFRSCLVVVEHDGVNVAHWNLDERPLASSDGGWTVAGRPLLLFHFSGIDLGGEGLTRHVQPSREAGLRNEAADRLVDAYRAEVFANGHALYAGLDYAWGRYDDGKPVTPLHRRFYRAIPARERDAEPFSSAGTLRRRLEAAGLVVAAGFSAPAVRASAVPGLGLLTRIVETSLRLFLRVAGAGRYPLLLRALERYARPENHAFLIGRPGPYRVDEDRDAA